MCCSAFLKVMMFAFNGIIFLAGAIVLGLGIWLKVDSNSLMTLLENTNTPDSLFQLDYVSYVLMAVGSVLLVIGFLGCCGAIMENRCMLLTFFSIVLIIFLVEVAGAIVLFVFSDVADELLMSLEDEVQSNIRERYGRDEDMTSVWDSTMDTFKCCGYRNYTDFTSSPFNLNSSLYPVQCCRPSSAPCSEGLADSVGVDGCFDRLLKLLEDNALIVAGVALGIAVLEIAAMVVSMVLYCDIGKK